MEGETMILTLKDSSILDDKRANINDDTDELENVLLARPHTTPPPFSST